jgi:hypothetical protein
MGTLEGAMEGVTVVVDTVEVVSVGTATTETE